MLHNMGVKMSGCCSGGGGRGGGSNDDDNMHDNESYSKIWKLSQIITTLSYACRKFLQSYDK
jgi:hypothetical protein